MRVRMRTWLLVLLIAFAVSSIAGAQAMTGTIIGKVTDSSGLAVPGATVTVTSPALIRAYTAVSSEKGEYRAINLPPGTYQLAVTLDGFQPVTVKGLVVTVGTVVASDVTMKPATIAETINVVAEAPTVDLRQTKNSQTITKEALNAVPLRRDPIAAMQITPGVVERSVAGSSRNEMAYLIDGTYQNAPDQGYAEANINWDTIEQIEFITTGNPAENYGVVGGALNIVTKSGGNMLSGTAQYYYSNKSLAQIVLPPEYRSAMKVGAAAAPLFDRDLSATLGGPIKKDSTWFFGSYKYLGQEILGSFIPTTIWGKQYDNYNAPYKQTWYNGKVTRQLTDKIRAFVMYNYSKGDRPQEFSVPSYRTLESTRNWSSKEGTLSSNLAWMLGPTTVLDARFGFWRFDYFGLAQPGSENQISYTDGYTRYAWGGYQPDATVKRNYTGSVKIGKYVGAWHGSHDLKAGFDLQRGYGSWIFWTPNGISQDVWNGDIYANTAQGLDRAVYGDGSVYFVTSAANQGGSYSASSTMRYGGFVQDIWRVNDRTTLNLGLRYDLTRGDIPAITKEPSSAFLVSIGEAYLKPAYGINPFGELKYDGWKNPIPWRSFAPQIGVAYDLFGNHKTALKAHWGRYQNNLPGWNFDGSEPSSPWTFAFNWWDNNRNGKLDAPGVDAYAQADNTNPIAMLGGTWKQAIDPNLKTPYLDEFLGGVDHEIATDVRLSVDYVWRNWANLLSNPYYDLQTGKFWSSADSGYWVPFNTTVPAYGTDFPAVPMTVYFQKANAPDVFNRLTNIDAAKATYQALNISVNKRMSHNWQLGGSFVYSRMAGNYPGTSGSPTGFFQTPNYSINSMGRIAVDRPIQVKLWGTAALPFQMQASFFYTYLNGTPWGRTVTIAPPASWAAANGTTTFPISVQVEPIGARRNTSQSNLDLRLEKVFTFGRHRFGAFVDLFNGLGFVYPTVNVNPAGRWVPNADGVTGTYTAKSVGLSGFSQNVRTVKLSMRWAF